MTAGFRLDLHVHSIRSPDGRETVDRLAAELARTEIDGFALTDHNTTDGHSALLAAGERYPERRFLPGVEVTAREGHLLAYGVRDPPPVGRGIAETIEWVRDHGGEPVLAHPFRFTHGVGGPIALTAAVRSIETVNSHNSPSANARAGRLAELRSLGRTGGSDAHRTADLGRAYACFPDGAETLDDLLEAIRRGRTTAEGLSLGPLGRLEWSLRAGFHRVTRRFRPV